MTPRPPEGVVVWAMVVGRSVFIIISLLLLDVVVVVTSDAVVVIGVLAWSVPSGGSR